MFQFVTFERSKLDCNNFVAVGFVVAYASAVFNYRHSKFEFHFTTKTSNLFLAHFLLIKMQKFILIAFSLQSQQYHFTLLRHGKGIDRKNG